MTATLSVLDSPLIRESRPCRSSPPLTASAVRVADLACLLPNQTHLACRLVLLDHLLLLARANHGPAAEEPKPFRLLLALKLLDMVIVDLADSPDGTNDDGSVVELHPLTLLKASSTKYKCAQGPPGSPSSLSFVNLQMKSASGLESSDAQ